MIEAEPTAYPDGAYSGPSYRIGRLEAALRKVETVKPNTAIAEAVTLMLEHNFSQLPVMTTTRHVKGMISWKSIANYIACGGLPTEVRDCIERHHEVSEEASLFEIIPIVAEHDYVLIRSNDDRIVGILTASDLSVEFRQLAEPFLLLRDIERNLREIARPCLGKDELRRFHDGSNRIDPAETVDELSLGTLIRILANQTLWLKLPISNLDRSTLTKSLDTINKIRNKVMHFRMERIDPKDLDTLIGFSRFIQDICTGLSTVGGHKSNIRRSNARG